MSPVGGAGTVPETGARETGATARPDGLPLRAGPVSWLLRLRSAVVAAVLLAGTVLLMALTMRLGDIPMSVAQVFGAVVGDGPDHFVVMELRLPRALTGALVGAALALSGAITQAVARNPLASPDILGVTTGASVTVVAVIVAAGSTWGGASGALAQVGVPVAALGGGLAGALAVYLLSWRRGLDGYRLVLVGIGVSAVCTNVKYWLLTIGDVNDSSRAMVWISGSLNGRGWEHVVPVGLALALLIPLTLLGTRSLGALRFSDETVTGLGVRMNLARGLMLLAAVLLAATATASAGPITFVALAAPQIALRLAGTAQPPLLVSALVGAALTTAADLVARTAFNPVELPVGVVTAVLGAPYLIYLLIRVRRKARS
ncbi:iron complex transport system permease protein [Streptosporangium becharense]|uniref:Iron complex transport system permease protein n=1 Tax=Streptosporangium becharense TaxID=1816182 RepID=A0A7W9IK12_9ACTN|nr:iron chelate uptake ABC transporter family permease subunit [Streptosporangium becharense]MBB2913826.1 iron complex transport system permease protein [Streptosporangium becharense]MBB5821513.1 iron complex transport system permease protein [Streptosporangium becharense]